MSRRLSSRVEQWVTEAVEKYAQGDDITWDMAFNIGEQGPVMLVAFFMPGALLGTSVQSILVLQNVVQMGQDDAERVTRDAVENLRKARTEQLSTQPGQEGLTAVPNNGRP